MADHRLTDLVTRIHPDVAKDYKTHDLANDGPILLTIFGRPVLIADEFSGDVEDPTRKEEALIYFHQEVTTGYDPDHKEHRLPHQFIVFVPPLPDQLKKELAGEVKS